VEKGETTWEELASLGLALPKKGDQVNALVAAFRAAKSAGKAVVNKIKAKVKAGGK
jgi:hypothetical protein